MSKTQVTWRVLFETPSDHPVPLVELVNTADYVLGFMAAVVNRKTHPWLVTVVEVTYGDEQPYLGEAR